MQQPSERDPAFGPRIFIVGSYACIRFLSGILRRPGYNIKDYPYNSQEGTHKAIITIAREKKPDLILLEIADPDDDSIRLFHQLREKVSPDCPLFVVTEQPDHQRFQEIHPTAFIPWPVDMEALRFQIDSLIGHLKPQRSQLEGGFMYPVASRPAHLPTIPFWAKPLSPLIRMILKRK